MTGSGYISASQDRMKSKYDSVQEQTGLFAGQGGFDVTVGRHTQLDGAAIASAATAEKNSLDTGTLGFSDIGNAADYKVSHTGISLSGGSSFGSTSGGSMAGGAPAMAASSGHAEGITRAAIGAGTITVRDQGKQQQNIAGLSRDTDNANGSIGPIFDREKEQKRLAAVGLVIEIGSQVSDIAKKQGELNGLKKAREAHPEMTAEQLKDTPEYRKVTADYGTGSNLQRGIQAATAALQGLAGGNIAGGLAAAAAPELANVLKSTEDKPEVNILAHAILGGAVAAMQGNSVAAGAAGAGVGELAAHGIMATLYPGKEASDLGEEDRQLISTLATISAGMAGGLAGDSTSSAAAGAQAGRNAVENNALSKDKPSIFDINPMMKMGVVDDNGDPLKGGGGIAKGGNRAVSSLEGAKLKEYYRQAEKYGQAGVKELENGNYRFYGDMTPSKTTGEMAGARLVREWDPKTDQTRTWYETLDHAGNIRSVAPKPVTNDKNHHIFDADGNYQGRR